MVSQKKEIAPLDYTVDEEVAVDFLDGYKLFSGTVAISWVNLRAFYVSKIDHLSYIGKILVMRNCLILWKDILGREFNSEDV